MKFKITFKTTSDQSVVEITGVEITPESLKLNDGTRRCTETQDFLQRLTGFKVHIEEVK